MPSVMRCWVNGMVSKSKHKCSLGVEVHKSYPRDRHITENKDNKNVR